MRFPHLLLTLVAVVPLLLDARVAAAQQKVAVLGIEPKDEGDPRSQQATTALARSLTDGLRVRARGTSGFQLAPGSQKDLTEQKLLSDCLDEATDCMTAIGRDLGADVLVFGHVEKKGAVYQVTVEALTVGAKKRTAAKARTVPVAEANDAAMRRLAVSLFSETTGAPVDTVLVVEAPGGDGARVVVNGKAVASIANGSATIRGLPAGKVTVAVESPAHERSEAKVDLQVGGTTRVTVALTARAGPASVTSTPTRTAGERPGGTARVLFWSSLVTTGAGVVAFTITGLQVRSIEREQDAAIAGWGNEFATNGVQHPDDACAEARADGFAPLRDVCDRGERMATITNVLIGVTAAAAVATGFFYWKGYLEPSRPEREIARSGRTRRRPPAVVIAPTIGKDHAGLGAAFQF